MSAFTVAVLAAGGHTGRLVVEAIARRGADVRALTRRDCDARDRASVRKAIEGADAFINLAGPFLANGLAPIEAAIDARVPYLDTTGEQRFMAMAHAQLDARAKDAGVAIVNAMAFEYALGDLAANAHFPEGGDALHILYRPRSTAPSAGTKKSMLRVFAAPTLSYEDGRLVRSRYGAHVRTFHTDDGPRMGASFAGGEVLTVPRHTPFRTVRTYFQSKPSSVRTARALAPLARLALHGPILRAADRAIDKRHRAPRNERARGEIHLVAGDKHIVVRTPDPYPATAEIVTEGALRLVGRAQGGVLAPAQAFDAARTLAALQERMPGIDVVEFPSLSSK